MFTVEKKGKKERKRKKAMLVLALLTVNQDQLHSSQ